MPYRNAKKHAPKFHALKKQLLQPYHFFLLGQTFFFPLRLSTIALLQTELVSGNLQLKAIIAGGHITRLTKGEQAKKPNKTIQETSPSPLPARNNPSLYHYSCPSTLSLAHPSAHPSALIP